MAFHAVLAKLDGLSDLDRYSELFVRTSTSPRLPARDRGRGGPVRAGAWYHTAGFVSQINSVKGLCSGNSRPYLITRLATAGRTTSPNGSTPSAEAVKFAA